MKGYHGLVPVWLLTLLLLFSLRRVLFAVDFYDTALLTTPLQRNCDVNFQKLCEYYGLRYKVIDLSTITLTDSLLRDESGEYLRLSLSIIILRRILLILTQIRLKFSKKPWKLEVLASLSL